MAKLFLTFSCFWPCKLPCFRKVRIRQIFQRFYFCTCYSRIGIDIFLEIGGSNCLYEIMINRTNKLHLLHVLPFETDLDKNRCHSKGLYERERRGDFQLIHLAPSCESPLCFPAHACSFIGNSECNWQWRAHNSSCGHHARIG